MTKSSLIYIYNDTFLSFLSLIDYLLTNKILPTNIKDSNYNPNLFEKTTIPSLKEDTTALNHILSFFGKNIFSTIYFCFISNHENKEIIIYHFLLAALKYPKNIYYRRNIKSVALTLKIAHYVKNEAHKMKGFLRFAELDNHILYAEMAPENNIIEILSNHFKRRLKVEYWIIHDTKRGLWSIYDKKDFYILTDDEFKLKDYTLSADEKDIRKLWFTFYDTIGIKERRNERCRMNFMPKKYWKYIIEMENENEKNS